MYPLSFHANLMDVLVFSTSEEICEFTKGFTLAKDHIIVNTMDARRSSHPEAILRTTSDATPKINCTAAISAVKITIEGISWSTIWKTRTESSWIRRMEVVLLRKVTISKMGDNKWCQFKSSIPINSLKIKLYNCIWHLKRVRTASFMTLLRSSGTMRTPPFLNATWTVKSQLS